MAPCWSPAAHRARATTMQTSPVFAAESWNPATERWTTLASATVPRLYHSTALLLPDGRVLTGGGDGHPEVEVFSPPYLFKGARPVMSAVPASMGYGQQVTVQSPDAASIQKVTLIRLRVRHACVRPEPAYDHAAVHTWHRHAKHYGSSQCKPGAARALHALHCQRHWCAVRGRYRCRSAAAAPPPPAPALGSLAPSSATAGGPAFTLTANGSNFVSGSAVHWNGAARATTFVSSHSVERHHSGGRHSRRRVPPRSRWSTLEEPRPVHCLSPSQRAPPPAAPALSSLAPSSATAGGPAFTLTANGSNFVSGAAVHWNGAARTTTFVSGTQLRATIDGGRHSRRRVPPRSRCSTLEEPRPVHCLSRSQPRPRRRLRRLARSPQAARLQEGPPSRSPPMAAISFRGRRCNGMARPARQPLSAPLS